MKSILMLRLVIAMILSGIVFFGCSPKKEEAAAVPVTAKLRPPKPNWEAPYRSEEHWLMHEIGCDIAEMVSYAKRLPVSVSNVVSVVVTDEKQTPEGGLAATITVTGLSGDQRRSTVVMVDDYIWSPKAYAGFAKLVIGDRENIGKSNTAPSGDSILKALLEPRSSTIEKENQRISSDLAQDMFNPEAHENAALILGMLSMREAAGNFYDVRKTLCRIVSHLALAEALRGAAPPNLNGKYAEAILLTMAGRETDALERLQALGAGAENDSVQQSWINALAVRNTRNWKLLATPRQSSLLERLEQVRALDVSVGGSQALAFIQDAGPEQLVDWSRILLERSFSVHLGHVFVPTALALEVADIQEVWQVSHPNPLEEERFVDVLNEMPGRCITLGEKGEPLVRVIDWGAWAQFSQRHLCHEIERGIYFIGTLWSAKETLLEYRGNVDRSFSRLGLYPIVAQRYVTGEKEHREAMGAIVRRDPAPAAISNNNLSCKHK